MREIAWKVLICSCLARERDSSVRYTRIFSEPDLWFGFKIGSLGYFVNITPCEGPSRPGTGPRFHTVVPAAVLMLGNRTRLGWAVYSEDDLGHIPDHPGTANGCQA
jgi:hypothetical protein